jgi:hypothetical protein
MILRNSLYQGASKPKIFLEISFFPQALALCSDGNWSDGLEIWTKTTAASELKQPRESDSDAIEKLMTMTSKFQQRVVLLIAGLMTLWRYFLDGF